MRAFIRLTPVAGLAMALSLAAAHAQTWPQKTVRLIVPLPPGSGMDSPHVSSQSG